MLHTTNGTRLIQSGAVFQCREVTVEDIAEVIAFAVSRPRHLAIHEILLRPASQQG